LPENSLKKIFIVAGESSGDMHAASMMRELKKIFPKSVYKGIGGPDMRRQGLDVMYDMKKVNFIGFSSVIKNLPALKKILNHCVTEIEETSPDAVILVDFPGFNLKLISSIGKSYKGKIIYYISPQLWAWHKSRIKTIKKFVDLMIVVFPFEVEFYSDNGVKAVFAGHPLVERIDDFLKNHKRIRKSEISISMLPGSRRDEIERMLPVMLEAAAMFKKKFDCEISFICSANLPRAFYESLIDEKKFTIVYSEGDDQIYYKTILNSDLAVTKSGTSTMECALLGIPFCVVYKTGKLNYAIGKNLVNVDHIAMVNILLKRRAVKEFLQNDMTADNIFAEGSKILTDKSYSEKMTNSFSELRKILTDNDASSNTAKLIASQILNEK